MSSRAFLGLFYFRADRTVLAVISVSRLEKRSMFIVALNVIVSIADVAFKSEHTFVNVILKAILTLQFAACRTALHNFSMLVLILALNHTIILINSIDF